MKSDIELKELFDYANFAHSKFFDQYKYPWEIITNLNQYIEDLVKEKPNKRIIGEGSLIDPSVKIDGPVIIGKNCTIEDNVLIRGGCILGDNVHVGHAVELKHSVILDNKNNTKISHLNYIGDSIIGNDVNVGGGAVIANWRLDRKNIIIKVDDGEFDTGTTKFGACIGDGSGIGANSVLNPGVILGKNSVVYPLVSVVGVFEKASVVKS